MKNTANRAVSLTHNHKCSMKALKCITLGATVVHVCYIIIHVHGTILDECKHWWRAEWEKENLGHMQHIIMTHKIEHDST